MPKDKSTKNSNNQMSKIIRTIKNLDTKNTLVGIYSTLSRIRILGCTIFSLLQ